VSPRLSRGAALVAVALLAVLGSGCARSSFPPGGPVDTIPPRVVASTPGDSVTNVPRNVSVEVVF